MIINAIYLFIEEHSIAESKNTDSTFMQAAEKDVSEVELANEHTDNTAYNYKEDPNNPLVSCTKSQKKQLLTLFNRIGQKGRNTQILSLLR